MIDEKLPYRPSQVRQYLRSNMKFINLKYKQDSWVDIQAYRSNEQTGENTPSSDFNEAAISRKLVTLWAFKLATQIASPAVSNPHPKFVATDTEVTITKKVTPQPKPHRVLQSISFNQTSNRPCRPSRPSVPSVASTTPIQEVNYKYNGSNTPKYSGQFLNLKVGKKVKRQCKLCNLIYTDLKGFNRHYQSVHLNQRHQCGKCYQIFVTPDNLSRHLQKHPSHFARS